MDVRALRFGTGRARLRSRVTVPVPPSARKLAADVRDGECAERAEAAEVGEVRGVVEEVEGKLPAQ